MDRPEKRLDSGNGQRCRANTPKLIGTSVDRSRPFYLPLSRSLAGHGNLSSTVQMLHTTFQQAPYPRTALIITFTLKNFKYHKVARTFISYFIYNTMATYLVLFNRPIQTVIGTALVFKEDDMQNTTICLRGNDTPLYQVDSSEDLARTTIRRASYVTPLATLEHRAIVSDKITFTGRRPTNVNSWLKSRIFSKFPVIFEERGKKYTWKPNFVGRLSLYAEHAPRSPIARFQPSWKKTNHGTTTFYPAYLALEPEAVEIQDMAVISFLILEQKSRANGVWADLADEKDF